jgi:hypothetical protein
MSDPFKTMMEGERQLINDAEDIFSRWKKKEFTLDVKANQQFMVITSSKYVRNWMGKEKVKDVKENMSVADAFINSLSHYEKDRGSPYGGTWRSVAGDLIHAYHMADGFHFIIDSKEKQIKSLEAENVGLMSKLSLLEKKLQDRREYDYALEVRNRSLEDILTKHHVDFPSFDSTLDEGDNENEH